MKLKTLHVKNYRTLEDVTFKFDGCYTAICGKNNSGKSNIIRAIRLVFGENDRDWFSDDIEISYKVDYPAWKKNDPKKENISIEVMVSVTAVEDQSLVNFIERLSQEKTNLPSRSTQYNFLVKKTVFSGGTSETKIVISDVEITDDFISQEIYKKLNNTIIFHNSTMTRQMYFTRRRRLHGILSRIPEENQKKIDAKSKNLQTEMNKVFKEQSDKLGVMLGSLGEKLEVKFTAPEFDVTEYPFEISLGYKDIDIPLDDWGAGTRNQTLIIKNLFDAKNLATSPKVTDRITPILLIEEPESFLHPLAQAHFSTVLQDITDELGIQVIATTHSPYLLSHESQTSNILLDRNKIPRSKIYKNSIIMPIEGDDWKKPFEHTLGVIGPEFEIFKTALFSKSNVLILVEGSIDKDYLELCRDEVHKTNALSQKGEIFVYEGYGTLISGSHLLKFMRDKYSKVIITYDLDAESKVKKNLESLGFKKNKTFFPIGIDEAGKRSIEGFLPERIKQIVNNDNSGLITAMQSDNKEESKKAKNSLKAKYLEKFKTDSNIVKGDFAEFYKFCNKINGAIKK